jgi:large subunit ribosomal protein L5
MNNIKSWYKNIVKIDFIYKTKPKNSFDIPKIDKVNVNISSKSVIENSKTILYPIMALKLITNQRPTICKAKRSVAVFKLRKGMLIGAKVTLRKYSCYDFLNLFILLILPSLKDFNRCKVNNSGALSVGIRNLLVFPQLSNYYDRFPKNISAIINIYIKNNKVGESKLLLTGLQIPVI